MNVADSELLASALSSRGYDEALSSNDADLVVVNTCSVRQHAEDRALSHITQIAAHKRQGKTNQTIWVIGCMAERKGETIAAQIPGVNRVIGARNFETFLMELDAYLEPAETTLLSTNQNQGIGKFVPIMRGCNNFCAYCIVPHVRGPEISLPTAAIEESIWSFIESGAKEITLLGQNVNSYRDGDIDFSGLLARLHDIPGLSRIRFTTSHPKDCSEKLVKTIAGLPKVCKHFHLPVQSGSDKILRVMNRKYTRDDYMRVIDAVLRHIPDADITTDAMVGFPGETEADFLDTLSLFNRVRFTTAFMFIYSKRDNTAAAAMDDSVSIEEKKQRLKTLIDTQTAITKQRYQACVGTSLSVLFTARQEEGDKMWMGQDNGCKRVLVSCNEPLAGMILPIRALRSSGMTIVGERE